jgi:hypothetical protein
MRFEAEHKKRKLQRSDSLVLRNHRAGVGGAPISIDALTTEKLVEALEAMSRPEVKAAAQRIAEQLNKVSLQPRPARLLPLSIMCCNLSAMWSPGIHTLLSCAN